MSYSVKAKPYIVGRAKVLKMKERLRNARELLERTEAQEKAVRDSEAAVKQDQKCQTARTGGTGAEAARVAAYKAGVAVGVFPPVKAKYLHGKALKQVR